MRVHRFADGARDIGQVAVIRAMVAGLTNLQAEAIPRHLSRFD